MKTGRNGRIEFFRFVFAIIVMIAHGRRVMNDGEYRIMFSGQLGVEFFFLVSGYLMAAAIAKIIERGEDFSVSRESERFLLKKFLSVYPMAAVSFVLFMMVYEWQNKLPFVEFLAYIIKRTPNLFLMEQTGIFFSSMNGTWYLSSMLVAMAILFPLGIKYYRFMRRLGFGLISLMTLGYVMQHASTLGGPTTMVQEITFRGNLRAVSEIAMGGVCFEAARALRKVNFTNLGCLLLGVIEVMTYATAILYMLLHKPSDYDFLCLLLLAIAVTCTFSGCNYNSKIWDKRIFAFLGKASLYVYLGHLAYARNLTFIIGEGVSNRMAMVIFIALGLSNAALLWAISEIIRRNMPKVRRLLITEA